MSFVAAASSPPEQVHSHDRGCPPQHLFPPSMQCASTAASPIACCLTISFVQGNVSEASRPPSKQQHNQMAGALSDNLTQLRRDSSRTRLARNDSGGSQGDGAPTGCCLLPSHIPNNAHFLILPRRVTHCVKGTDTHPVPVLSHTLSVVLLTHTVAHTLLGVHAASLSGGMQRPCCIRVTCVRPSKAQ